MSGGIWSRVWGWAKRHKVLAVFCALIAAGGLLYAGLSVEFEVKVHFERREYMRAQKLIGDVISEVTLPGSPQVTKSSECRYTSPAGVFAKGHLGCNTRANIVYSNTSKEDAQKVSSLLRQEMMRKGLHLQKNPHGLDENDISTDVFDIGKLGCFVSSTYYDEIVPAYERDGSASKVGKASLTMIYCGGPAKAEYFPVTKN